MKFYRNPVTVLALSSLLIAILSIQMTPTSSARNAVTRPGEMPLSLSNVSALSSTFLLDGNSANGEITVRKRALLNGEPVDEVCGGQTVTFEYTVTNNVVMWPAFPPIYPNPVPAGPLYYVNILDSDPTLGDIDGTVVGLTMQPGATLTLTKTKTIAIGETSSSSMAVTANYAQSGSPGDAVSATDTWTVVGVNCEVEVEKRVNGVAPSGGQAFTFEVRTGASINSVGTPIAMAVANAANGGSFGIASLQLNTQYQFCETGLAAGWATSLSQYPGAFVPNSAGGNPDNSVVCVDFMLDPEQPTVFLVNNTTPVGGPPRTIGYWKNWASCSPGRQAPVLDYVLSRFGFARAAPPSPLPSPLPAITTGVTFGGASGLVIDTCQEAVNVLNKSTTGGVKKASHPAYNMAAQLLAVKLNLQAGADPSCIEPYVAEAEQLLIAIGFNGTGSPGYSTTQGSRMNTLATYFDRYNNGDPTLCPIPTP